MNLAIRTLFLFGVSCYASTALAAPTFNIVTLGLTDAEHTRNDGYEYSIAHEMNEAGQVSGYSSRYNGGSTDLGQSVWLYDGATSINIGLVGSEHTRNDGYQHSRVGELNQVGQVHGASDRYSGGSTKLGESAWLYNGTATIDIGFAGPAHTRSDGYKFSTSFHLNDGGQVTGQSQLFNGGTSMGYSAWLYDGATTIDLTLNSPEYIRRDGYRASGAYELNEAGQVSGSSQRYNGGSADLGNSAWVYDGVTTTVIGLVGPSQTRSDGYRLVFAFQLNKAGQVRGYSQRFNGSNSFGYSAWLYNGATTIDIGLNDTMHTRNDGYKYSRNDQLNEAGQVRGYSQRFNGGSTDLGQTAWLYNGTTTIDIGLIGPEHTRNDGRKYSDTEQLNEAGQVRGFSYRWNGDNPYSGRSVWLYNGGTTIDVGLTGPAHTRNDGYKGSYADDLNEIGQVIGYSMRFNSGSADLGQSAWLYGGAPTIDIGLTGPAYTRSDGYKFSLAEELNDSGQVSGYSYRYNGGTPLGQDAWFYDTTLAQTIQLQLSSRSDGYAYSSIEYLGDDGLALGNYRLFNGLGNDLGLRAFYFTIADGLHDLGSLVNGGLAANGWQSLADAIRANDQGQILGHGKLTAQSGGQIAYLLTSVVPEPSSLFLATFAAIGSRRRRQYGNRQPSTKDLLRPEKCY